METATTYPADRVMVWYRCIHCGETGFQYLDEIAQDGTAICRECDIDMGRITHIEILPPANES